jgi:hypothetical protein
VSVLIIRAHKRFAVCRKGQLRKPGRRGVEALLIELSLDGCRIGCVRAPAGLAIGDVLTLSVNGAEAPLEGRVRWLGEGMVGLRFTRPLHNDELEDLIRVARGEMDPPLAACAG